MPNPEGRRPIDDQEAVDWVRTRRRENSQVSYREYARRFLKNHPNYIQEKSPDSSVDSVARRIADKARKADGVLKRSDTALRRLQEIERSLGAALYHLGELIKQERNRR